MGIRVFELDRLGVRVFYTPTSAAAPQKPILPKDPLLSNCSHKHSYYELHIIEAGALHIQVENAQYEGHAGQFYLVCPGVSHAPQLDAERVCKRFCLHFELLSEPAPLSAYIKQLSCQAGILIGDADKLIPILQQLRSNDCFHPLFSEELIHQMLSQMFVQLVRSVAAPPSESITSTSNLSELRTVHIDQFFNNRFYYAEGENVLASELGVSRRQLNRIIQGIYGKSYREKLLEVRAEAACELLVSDLPVREIAERLGYSTSANFTAFFKNAVGMTPSEYRRKNKL